MNITLRSVYKNGPESIRALYELLRARSTEADPYVNISHRGLPPFQEHARFVRSKPYRAWYLVRVDGLTAGSVNLTKLNEVGIVLHPDYRGKGVGKVALRLLLNRHRPLPAIPAHRSSHWLSNINPKNERSISLFEGLGFKHIQNTYQL